MFVPNIIGGKGIYSTIQITVTLFKPAANIALFSSNIGNSPCTTELEGIILLAQHRSEPAGHMGREEFRQLGSAFYSAFPDFNHTIEDQIAEGDRVVTRQTLRGTHKGPFQGLTPTEKQFTITAIAIDRVSEGKIIERWIDFDVLGLMQQIGAIPAPGQSG